MPFAFVLDVEPADPSPLPISVGECLNAAFFAVLDAVAPDLAAQLHALEERKPFTLCPLFDPDSRAPRLIGIRFTVLTDDLLPPVLDSLIAVCSSRPLRIGGAQYSATRLHTAPQTHPLARSATFEELLDGCVPAERLHVAFLSPTVFRSQKRDVLWPEPRLVWQSWVRAWNAWSGIELAEEQAVAWAAQVLVAEHRIHTDRLPVIAAKQSGFVGAALYDLTPLDPPARAVLAALADFAFYAGTGRKTALGMGQTERLPLAARLNRRAGP